jgi:hypothetical protein
MRTVPKFFNTEGSIMLDISNQLLLSTDDIEYVVDGVRQTLANS